MFLFFVKNEIDFIMDCSTFVFGHMLGCSQGLR